MSDTLSNVLRECQPFKDGAATIVCIGCLQVLAFPSGAKKVKCSSCTTVTSAVKVKCTACGERVTVPLGTRTTKCPKCLYEFTPVAKLKIIVPEKGAVENNDRIIDVVVRVDRSVQAVTREARLQLIVNQPLRESAQLWAGLLQADFSNVAFYNNEKSLTASSTPRQLQLQPNAVIEVRRSKAKNLQGHDFATSQFSGPTNCALCKEFIWGIYHQGKRCTKCRLPVHHRCAANVTSLCETSLREIFGIVNYNDEDDEGEGKPVIGVVVDEKDKIAFAAHTEEVVAPECDRNFMKTFDKLSNFTDEQIQEMWLKYDKDESGTLDHEEIRDFLLDLLDVGTFGSVDRSADIRAPVEHLIARMDSNGDGVIQWEEFWYFFKAQQDANFLEKFKKVGKLTTEQLYELWYNYDEDGSGRLEVDELLKLLNDLLEGVDGNSRDAVVLKAKYRGHFESFLTGDGCMTWEQFCTVIVPLIQQAVNA
jgi:LSD1 subclass zinc finger protein